jgi:hypothetical protein
MLRKMAPRSDADILADAIRELAPCDEQERARLIRCVEGLRATARGKKAPTPGKKNKQLRARLNRMQKVRADLIATGSAKDLIERFDEQIGVVESMLSPVVIPNSPPPNITASCAVAIAHDLLQKSGRRVRWTGCHRLGTLIYEFATGEYDFSLSKYLSMYKDGRIATTRLGVMITGKDARVTVTEDKVWITAEPAGPQRRGKRSRRIY